MRFKEKEQINQRQIEKRSLLTQIEEKEFILVKMREETQMFADEAERARM